MTHTNLSSGTAMPLTETGNMNKGPNRSIRYYYARHCGYGIDVVCEDSRGNVDRFPGMIARFSSRRARDSWVADEIWDGKFCREAISAGDVAIAARYRGFCKGESLVWYAGCNEGPMTNRSGNGFSAPSSSSSGRTASIGRPPDMLMVPT